METGVTGIERDASKYGIVRVLDDYQRVRWRVQCGTCDLAVDKHFPTNCRPEAMVRTFRVDGWLVKKGKRPMCSTCQMNKRQVKSLHDIVEAINQPPTQPEVQATQEVSMANTTGPDPKIMRKVFNLLEDHFNDKTRRYDSGWDDERVAKEVGTSLAVVGRIRSDAYGELAEDPALVKLRDDVHRLQQDIEKLESDLLSNAEEAVGSLRKRLADIAARVPAVAGSKAAG